MRTIQELAKEAIAVQDACNLSGVMISAAKAVSDLREACPDLGTRGINRHPVMILWIDKMASLAGIQDLGNDDVGDAYRKCRELAGTPALGSQPAYDQP